ncbi:hypothetical protein GW17_00009828 [Ensete ventricosum]|nr:hypothetical protein GW17_00009828 [Ensete ventricosum]
MDIDGILSDVRVVNHPTKSAIYIWGYNDSGQTARKGKDCHLRIPKSLSHKLFNCAGGDNLRWLDIACGREHTAAVASDGSLFTWGECANDFGQLGDGAEESRKHPKKVKSLQTEYVKSVSCGAHYTCYSSDKPGYNEYGQLGRGFTSEGLQGARILNAYARFLDEPPELVKIRQVACGEYHTAAISEDGDV